MVKTTAVSGNGFLVWQENFIKKRKTQILNVKIYVLSEITSASVHA